jgi:hypothetical protein
MVSEPEVLEVFLKSFPDFKIIWEKEIGETWEGNSPGLSLDMAEFSHYIEDLILENNSKNESTIKKAFELAEKFMLEGKNRVQDAVATCFLENLINAVAWEAIPASSFVHLLGEESRKYCIAWDDFTGVKTEGLD